METLRPASPPFQAALGEYDLMDLDEPHMGDAAAHPLVDVGDSALTNAEDTDREPEDGTKKKLIVNPPRKPRKISEKRRADNAAFDRWIEENQQNLSRSLPQHLLDDGEQSFQCLIRNFENRRIIASPRDYQLELFERAKTQNTIAVLDTGSGKTLIAALLLRWTIQNELEDRSKGMPKRVAFFLVDKVALVFQQHAVLECNLDYPVEKFCGDMVEEVSSKEFWEKTFAENMAIVCTAEILYQCLHHSYIRMEQINLLVFDEAHHTKKNHPYARIIKDFYAEVQDDERRPRIFGMTASPVDAQIDPKIAAAELEGLLHSQIATVADPAALQHSASRLRSERVVEYCRRPADWDTDLTRALRELVGGHRSFSKPFAFAASAAAELGPWCADRYWQLYFKEEDVTKLVARSERELLRASAYHQHMDAHVSKVREAHEMVNRHNFVRPCLSPGLLSSKVVQLVRVLRDQFNGVDHNRRCIVFVRQRNVAALLADLLQQPEMKIPGLEPGVLVGGGRPEASYDKQKITYREQVLTIIKFKRGELNCIFATSVAEEGLDIPDCNVIVRYDLNNTLIQYIQSRGRARQEGSTYIHMVEKGNADHCRKLHLNKHNEEALRRFCEAMPEDRKLTGNSFDMDYFLRKEKDQRQYTVPETGAKLNYKQSLICLAHFVASLPHPPEVSLTADYVVLAVPGGFQSEVMLPDSSPIKSATGRVHVSKAAAKCSAAFEMCLQLIKGKYLDQHLRPIFTKQLPAMRNARLAVSSKKKEQYNMRIKPEIWSSLGEPSELFVVALTLADPQALGRPSSPLLLLTRQPIPQIAPFPLFFGTNRSSMAHCVPVPGSVKLGDPALAPGLLAFTLAVFKDVFSKEYEATAAQLPYFLAPARDDHGFDFGSVSDPGRIIDWNTVRFIQENERIRCTFNEPDDFFKDKYVADPYDGSRKFFTRRRRHDMKPTDPVPEGVVAPGHRAWRLRSKRDILNYSLSAWSKSRASMAFQEDQPVVEAELLSVRRNLLDDNVRDEDMEPKQCFIVLQHLRISPLPVDVVAMAYNFPAIIHCIDANLVALDACRMLGLHIRPDLALEAFTKDSDNTEEHDVEKVNFQPGMGNNYERLEFLGDSFLKMATTISIFTLIPDKAEFEYHVERMLLICNRNLFNNALEVKLEEYIRSMAFDRRSWYPEGLVLKKGKRKDLTRKHVLADKTIADVCEALIGAAYLTGQERDAGDFDPAVQAVTAVVRDKHHAMTAYGDYYAAYTKPAWQTAPCNSAQLDMAERFRSRLGYAFRHPRLLRSAFQHPTYPSVYERLPSYQRLEFLGDALLDMACVEHLFGRFPGADPQWLTEHKMAMVSNQFLGCLAVCLGFHRSLAHCSPQVQREVAEYAAEIEAALAAARAEAAGEDDFAHDFWLACSRPPKCLPDVVEAYVGAVFVDSEYDFGAVRAFFDAHVRPFFEDMRPYDAFANQHPVTFLGGLMQKRFRCAEWRLLAKEWPGIAAGGAATTTTTTTTTGNADGDDNNGGADGGTAMQTQAQVVCAVMVHGRTLAHAVAASSRYGKIAAAKKAVQALEGMEIDHFRRAYGCACAPDGEAGEGLGEGQGEVDHGSAI